MPNVRFNRLPIILVCVLLCIPQPASPEGDAGRDAPQKPAGSLTASDVAGIESIRDVSISPNGRWIAWVRRVADQEKNTRRNDIFLTRLADTLTVQLTRDSGNDRLPRFSPDGSALAFIRTEKKAKPQLYLYRMAGGEPEKLTSLQTGVRRFAWRSDGEILYTAREDSTLREVKLAKERDDAVVVADTEHYMPVRLFGLDTKSKKVRRLTVNDGEITEFAVSPDGRMVVTNENQDVNYEYDQRIPPRQFLLDLDSGGCREILTAPHVDPFNFQWDAAGGGFYCIRRIASDSTDTYVGIRRLYYYDLSTDRLAPVDAGWERGIGYTYGTVRDGAVVPLMDGTRYRIAIVRKTKRGYRKRILEAASGTPMVLLASQRNGHRIVYSVSDASSIPDVCAATIKGGKLEDEQTVVQLNEKLRTKRLAKSEIIRWRGALDEDIEGILYYPLEYRKGKRYPLVVSLHGGPAGVDRDFFTEGWSNYPHLLATRGTFILKVNYHGSAGYGLAWVESIKGHYYEYEVPDILSGVDHLVKLGLVDPERIGIMGWSNGSILAIECCLRSKHFRALCAGAGDVNWISDYGNCAFGAAFDNAYLGGPPWEDVDTYIEKSPLFRMDDLATPTLIMFGTKDINVPTEQGWEHFRAMQQIGTTPVRFLLFPGAAHGLAKPSHQKRKIEEELAWFDLHLFETYEAPDESLAEGSPLALLIKRSKAARHGGLLGETVDGILTPETVECAGLNVGRFEITRAQYAAFDAGYTYPIGTGNFPANGITFEQARDYCAWLSERTGRRFRLPTKDEMTKLIAAAKGNINHENNLEYWAGYTPAPEERESLAAKMEGLGEADLFLKEAGSFKPTGEHGVYDLGGNVAELVTTENKGTVMGLSAVSTADKRTDYVPPPMAYVGFRIVEVE
ncbi:MAG: prolyl oligopeptidase family serine peptidase [bacterium]|nr:MAG: prolyl oligopeptidase family serine peptidase [bacterium]